MPVIKKNKKDDKENIKVDVDSNEVVSAYSNEGKRRNEPKNQVVFSTKYKILYFIICVVGLVLALFIIYLIEKYE